MSAIRCPKCRTILADSAPSAEGHALIAYKGRSYVVRGLVEIKCACGEIVTPDKPSATSGMATASNTPEARKEVEARV